VIARRVLIFGEDHEPELPPRHFCRECLTRMHLESLGGPLVCPTHGPRKWPITIWEALVRIPGFIAAYSHELNSPYPSKGGSDG
jgi:hypothetical protein